MSELQALSGAAAAQAADLTAGPVAAPPSAAPGIDFASVLHEATQALDARVADADRLVRNFVVDDTIPIHEVTIALEEARIAVEFAVQVRTRLVEAYRDIVNMPL